MREENRQRRKREIEAVAYELLGKLGYEGTSMLAVAKAAKASNETLYRWYGDKNGLFESMVEANAAEVKAALEAALDRGSDPMTRLTEVAPLLLGMLLGDRAIVLNRAAAADATGDLGRAITRAGREAVLPLIGDLLETAIARGVLSHPAEGTIAPLFMFLLVGDQQIRRVIGAMPPPTPEAVTEQAQIALARLQALCPPVRT